MLVKKLKVKSLVIGSMCIAYSAKSKMLSSNGNKGVFVRIDSVENGDVKLTIMHNKRVMTLKRLDEREDAWIYSPADGMDIGVSFTGKEKLFPGSTPRMQEAFQGKTIKWDSHNLLEHKAPGQEGTYYRFEQDGIWNNFNFAWMMPAKAPEWRIPRALRMAPGAIEVLLPPKPVSAEEEALILSMKDTLAEFKPHVKHNATAAFSLLTDVNKTHRIRPSAACHYELGVYTDIKYVISGCRNPGGEITDAEYLHYITYLVEHSPFKDAFLIKSAEWIRENGYVLTGDVSAQMVAGACIATRQVWENPSFVKAFLALAEKGVPLNLAFVLGSSAMGRNVGKDLMWGAAGTGHTVFDLSIMGDKELLNYHEGVVVNQNEKPYHTKNQYIGVNDMWGRGVKSKVLVALSEIGEVGKYGARAAMPFADSIDAAAEIIDKWIQANL